MTCRGAVKYFHPYLFADDTKLFKGIFSSEDCAQLQIDHDRMSKSTNTRLLKFHTNEWELELDTSQTDIIL